MVDSEMIVRFGDGGVESEDEEDEEGRGLERKADLVDKRRDAATDAAVDRAVTFIGGVREGGRWGGKGSLSPVEGALSSSDMSTKELDELVLGF